MLLQSAIRLIYPPQCISCGERTMAENGLCASCWGGVGFISGLVCDKCGVPLLGEDHGDTEYCDDCITIARPWAQGRAAISYTEIGRKITLALKHGDRLDVVKPASDWMVRAAKPMLKDAMIVAPVPLHWRRLFKRRYNQSALLARHVAKATRLTFCPDLLVRHRPTPSQEGRNRDERFANMAGAIRTHPKRLDHLDCKHILLVDDVMTSGATFAACAEACLAQGASEVSILALARVAKAA